MKTKEYSWFKIDCPICGNGLRELPKQEQDKEWVWLMRGVRAEGDFVIIKVNGGNDEARFLCEELINEMTIHKEKT